MENYKKCFAYNEVLNECKCLKELYCEGNKNCHFYNDEMNMNKIEQEIKSYSNYSRQD